MPTVVMVLAFEDVAFGEVLVQQDVTMFQES